MVIEWSLIHFAFCLGKLEIQNGHHCRICFPFLGKLEIQDGHHCRICLPFLGKLEIQDGHHCRTCLELFLDDVLPSVVFLCQLEILWQSLPYKVWPYRTLFYIYNLPLQNMYIYIYIYSCFFFDITEILLKIALNTITPNQIFWNFFLLTFR